MPNLYVKNIEDDQKRIVEYLSNTLGRYGEPYRYNTYIGPGWRVCTSYKVSTFDRNTIAYFLLVELPDDETKMQLIMAVDNLILIDWNTISDGKFRN